MDRVERDTVKLAAIFATGFYLVSLFLPGFLFSHNPPLLGYEILAWGWWGVLFGNFAWCANILFLVSAVLAWQGKVKRGAVISAAGLLVSAQMFVTDEWWFNEGSGTQIKALGSGAMLWFAVMAAMLCIHLFGFYKLKTQDA